jgi:hypothetical protein
MPTTDYADEKTRLGDRIQRQVEPDVEELEPILAPTPSIPIPPPMR